MEPESKLTPAQRYYQKHKEARKAYGREYYDKHKDKILNSNKKKKVTFDTVTNELETVPPVAPSPLDNFRGRGVVVKKGYDIRTEDIMVSFS